MTRHLIEGSQPASVPVSRPPVWSQYLLRTAARVRPVQNIFSSPIAAEFVNQAVTTDERAQDRRAEGRLLLAEQLEARAEAQRRAADSQDQHVSLLLSLSADEQLHLAPLDLNQTSAWLHNTPPPLQLHGLTIPLEARQAETSRQLLDQIDEALLNDHPGSDLQRVLEAGLQKRVGQNLTTSEQLVFRYLLATGAIPRHNSVCETCALVSSAPRSRQCLSCRRSPPRPTPQPWHRKITITNRPRATTRSALTTGATGSWQTNRQPAALPRVIYHVECPAGHLFTTADARQRYCDQCRTPSARTARHRTKEPTRS